MIFNLAWLQARQTVSSIKTKVLLRIMLLDTTTHQDVLIKQALIIDLNFCIKNLIINILCQNSYAIMEIFEPSSGHWKSVTLFAIGVEQNCWPPWRWMGH